MIKNKKAWLRILEAFIAVMMITSVLVVLYVRNIEKPKKSEEIYKIEYAILEEISQNTEFRDSILKNSVDMVKINEFVEKRIQQGFEFSIKICEVESICELADYKGEEGKEIYSKERIVSSNLEQYAPKKLKIFMWEA